jgi:signal transduction histidine kinase
VGELKRGIDRARRLVQQLLAFARLEPGAPSEPHERVNIAGLVRDVVGSYAVQAEERGADLGADAPSVTEIMGDECELRSLVANLVDNALRYTPENGAVTVSVRRKDSTVQLLVVDDGPGIPVAERERVFERFYRMPRDTTPGSGLGLAIVKAIVERHEGTVTLIDAIPGAERPGLGVRIELPVAPDSKASRRPDPVSQERTSEANLKEGLS